ncbi:putative leucine-rich repeat and transmembrane domain-containing protein 2-like [Scophthalmus maximus]|uniref:Putative leucine-rich repeat and transmembrane domain-containing protein 2-like n=1 Tax=Scophthalmus maximus TaxID=52904 RepID=A0A2U9BIN2_SCOMX|nr:putative leucine-rich repeat and transmembrane domain-containing protein 2-like [Scophthalmus maximus]
MQRGERDAEGDVRILRSWPNTGLLIPGDRCRHANCDDPHGNRDSSEKLLEMVLLWSVLPIFTLLVEAGLAAGCVCPAATALSQFPSEVPAGACCLNFSGSALGHVRWPALTNETNIETLDLSNCNVSSVDGSGREASSLRRVYLGHNRLTTLPKGFLAGQPGLTEVDLSGNLLRELPEGFLQDSDRLQTLYLQGNQLRLLPGSVLRRPGLRRLELEGNPWHCSCLLLEALEEGRKANRTTRLQDLVGNLTCASPAHLAGRNVCARDIYEEVEIKLGSAESLPRVPSRCSSSAEGRQGSQEPDGASRTELDTVSVTEVMKDSADRERAYLTQSTEYYSLVPGIELEDSDHGEYENVDLS